jgi:predicted hotdog family 3-hydroxylacyl-ACP dehydratase
MSRIELSAILDELNLKDRQELENLRTACYYSVLPHSGKGLKITDIMSFPWDNDKTETSIEVSNETKNRLEIEADDLINKL